MAAQQFPYGALLGIAVIGPINNRMYLLQLNASIQFMITAAVLLIAVIIDSVSRYGYQVPAHASYLSRTES